MLWLLGCVSERVLVVEGGTEYRDPDLTFAVLARTGTFTLTRDSGEIQIAPSPIDMGNKQKIPGAMVGYEHVVAGDRARSEFDIYYLRDFWEFFEKGGVYHLTKKR
jgi:hypothetical protein